MKHNTTIRLPRTQTKNKKRKNKIWRKEEIKNEKKRKKKNRRNPKQKHEILRKKKKEKRQVKENGTWQIGMNFQGRLLENEKKIKQTENSKQEAKYVSSYGAVGVDVRWEVHGEGQLWEQHHKNKVSTQVAKSRQVNNR